MFSINYSQNSEFELFQKYDVVFVISRESIGNEISLLLPQVNVQFPQLSTHSFHSCLLLLLASPLGGLALFIQSPEEADEHRMVHGELRQRPINVMSHWLLLTEGQK